MDTLAIIINRMNDLKLSQKCLCEKLGISQQAFTNWKGGFTTSYMKKLPQIAEILGVSVDYLLGNTDDPTPAAQRSQGTKKAPADVSAGAVADNDAVLAFGLTRAEMIKAIVSMYGQMNDKEKIELLAKLNGLGITDKDQ